MEVQRNGKSSRASQIHMVNKSYFFCEGSGNNELTLEREDAIEGMRAYIASMQGVNAGNIVELEDVKE